MTAPDRLTELIEALDRAKLSEDERQAFFAYLAFAAAATTGGPQSRPILALIGTLAAAAGVKELDTAEAARGKIDAYLKANPPPAAAMAAFRAWRDNQSAEASSFSQDDLAKLMIASPTQGFEKRNAPAPDGSVPAGPLARFKLGDET